MKTAFAQSRVILVHLLALCALAACSPQFNWRVVPNTDIGYMATYPDKPVQVTRTMDLVGLKVPLTLQAAQIEGLYFAVGTVPLQGDLAAQGTVLRDALAQAVANNISAGKPELKQVQWLGKTVQDMLVTGTLPNGKAAFAQARFFEHQGVLYEVIMMGPGQQANPDASTSWFGGFSLLGQ